MIESQRHSYHLVDPSPCPISGSLGALATTIICGIRQYLGHLTKEHHVGFEAAAWDRRDYGRSCSPRNDPKLDLGLFEIVPFNRVVRSCPGKGAIDTHSQVFRSGKRKDKLIQKGEEE
ncbi:Cytochrome c oxidase subunit 3 [Capsicum baccatum]|uniref:Cytochrome c oxidase subunit 3 n=1 Tax=Capsicum baccatum TaxID=33114 RepID=A0A2G2VKW4_CAPBA|nr:Cytochrome c oxidase subunit 3 [Capsicum baccatum]